MTIVDRYVLRLYFKVFAVCFASLTGLFIVIETFNNLEEFIELGKANGGLLNILADYFIARSFSFFDRASHLVALMAAIFSITWLQKTNEMTSIMAAGVPQWRVLKPVILASILVTVVGVANREWTIPKYRNQLVRNAQSWSGETPQPMQSRVDAETEFFFSGNQVIPAESRILQPTLHLDRVRSGWGNRISADQAVYLPASDDHPSGYRFEGVTKPRDLYLLTSIKRDDQILIFAPTGTHWLEPDQCFVVSGLDFDQLASGDQLMQFAPTLEIVKNIRSPSMDYGASLRVTAHARVLRPFLDLSLLLIGLPVVIARRDRNIFVAAGLCVGVIAVFIVTSLLFTGLGTYGILPPFAAAWGPLVVFVPVAAVAIGTLKQ